MQRRNPTSFPHGDNHPVHADSANPAPSGKHWTFNMVDPGIFRDGRAGGGQKSKQPGLGSPSNPVEDRVIGKGGKSDRSGRRITHSGYSAPAPLRIPVPVPVYPSPAPMSGSQSSGSHGTKGQDPTRVVYSPPGLRSVSYPTANGSATDWSHSTAGNPSPVEYSLSRDMRSKHLSGAPAPEQPQFPNEAAYDKFIANEYHRRIASRHRDAALHAGQQNYQMPYPPAAATGAQPYPRYHQDPRDAASRLPLYPQRVPPGNLSRARRPENDGAANPAFCSASCVSEGHVRIPTPAAGPGKMLTAKERRAKMEKERIYLESFYNNVTKWPSRKEQRSLAADLGRHTAHQVIIWFLNRRNIDGDIAKQTPVLLGYDSRLEDCFVFEAKHPDPALVKSLAAELGASEQYVADWFQLRREKGLVTEHDILEGQFASGLWNPNRTQLQALHKKMPMVVTTLYIKRWFIARRARYYKEKMTRRSTRRSTDSVCRTSVQRSVPKVQTVGSRSPVNGTGHPVQLAGSPTSVLPPTHRPVAESLASTGTDKEAFLEEFYRTVSKDPDTLQLFDLAQCFAKTRRMPLAWLKAWFQRRRRHELAAVGTGQPLLSPAESPIISVVPHASPPTSDAAAAAKYQAIKKQQKGVALAEQMVEMSGEEQLRTSTEPKRHRDRHKLSEIEKFRQEWDAHKAIANSRLQEYDHVHADPKVGHYLGVLDANVTGASPLCRESKSLQPEVCKDPVRLHHQAQPALWNGAASFQVWLETQSEKASSSLIQTKRLLAEDETSTKRPKTTDASDGLEALQAAIQVSAQIQSADGDD
ncbi:hypothetical protein HDU91_001586 [Kappamyces sp. JEL0680]|nr:hypothetical protein HDU91_001586 [Kappamyces sp. JEL0680]